MFVINHRAPILHTMFASLNLIKNTLQISTIRFNTHNSFSFSRKERKQKSFTKIEKKNKNKWEMNINNYCRSLITLHVHRTMLNSTLHALLFLPHHVAEQSKSQKPENTHTLTPTNVRFKWTVCACTFVWFLPMLLMLRFKTVTDAVIVTL